MLTIPIYIFFTITAILSVWIVTRTFKEPTTFNLGITPFIFKNINIVFKTSFNPNKNSFVWGIISVIVHSPLIFFHKELFSRLHNYLPLKTREEAGFVVIFAIVFIGTFVWFRKKVTNIFNELKFAVHEGDPVKIKNWIKKYEKYPYFLKIAIHDYSCQNSLFDEVYQSLTWHEDLQKDLPKNDLQVKKKITKL